MLYSAFYFHTKLSITGFVPTVLYFSYSALIAITFWYGFELCSLIFDLWYLQVPHGYDRFLRSLRFPLPNLRCRQDWLRLCLMVVTLVKSPTKSFSSFAVIDHTSFSPFRVAWYSNICNYCIMITVSTHSQRWFIQNYRHPGCCFICIPRTNLFISNVHRDVLFSHRELYLYKCYLFNDCLQIHQHYGSYPKVILGFCCELWLWRQLSIFYNVHGFYVLDHNESMNELWRMIDTW